MLETDGRNTNMTYKIIGLNSLGLIAHLHKGFHENQCFEQKIEYLRMTLIDQVVGEIITEGSCKLCELEKEWINRLQTFKELITTMIIFLIVAVPTNVR